MFCFSNHEHFSRPHVFTLNIYLYLISKGNFCRLSYFCMFSFYRKQILLLCLTQTFNIFLFFSDLSTIGWYIYFIEESSDLFSIFYIGIDAKMTKDKDRVMKVLKSRDMQKKCFKSAINNFLRSAWIFIYNSLYLYQHWKEITKYMNNSATRNQLKAMKN